MLNATIHHSSFSSHCRSCFKINNLKSEFSGSATSVANPLWTLVTFHQWTDWGLVAALRRRRLREPSWHLNTERGGAGASLLPTSPTGQGMGIVKRRIRRVSTTRPGSPWIPDHFHGEELPRKGTKEDFCCLNCYLPAKPSVCPKVLIINYRKNILVSSKYSKLCLLIELVNMRSKACRNTWA